MDITGSGPTPLPPPDEHLTPIRRLMNEHPECALITSLQSSVTPGELKESIKEMHSILEALKAHLSDDACSIDDVKAAIAEACKQNANLIMGPRGTLSDADRALIREMVATLATVKEKFPAIEDFLAFRLLSNTLPIFARK